MQVVNSCVETMSTSIEMPNTAAIFTDDLRSKLLGDANRFFKHFKQQFFKLFPLVLLEEIEEKLARDAKEELERQEESVSHAQETKDGDEPRSGSTRQTDDVPEVKLEEQLPQADDCGEGTSAQQGPRSRRKLDEKLMNKIAEYREKRSLENKYLYAMPKGKLYEGDFFMKTGTAGLFGNKVAIHVRETEDGNIEIYPDDGSEVEGQGQKIDLREYRVDRNPGWKYTVELTRKDQSLDLGLSLMDPVEEGMANAGLYDSSLTAKDAVGDIGVFSWALSHRWKSSYIFYKEPSFMQCKILPKLLQMCKVDFPPKVDECITMMEHNIYCKSERENSTTWGKTFNLTLEKMCEVYKDHFNSLFMTSIPISHKEIFRDMALECSYPGIRASLLENVKETIPERRRLGEWHCLKLQIWECIDEATTNTWKEMETDVDDKQPHLEKIIRENLGAIISAKNRTITELIGNTKLEDVAQNFLADVKPAMLDLIKKLDSILVHLFDETQDVLTRSFPKEHQIGNDRDQLREQCNDKVWDFFHIRKLHTYTFEMYDTLKTIDKDKRLLPKYVNFQPIRLELEMALLEVLYGAINTFPDRLHNTSPRKYDDTLTGVLQSMERDWTARKTEFLYYLLVQQYFVEYKVKLLEKDTSYQEGINYASSQIDQKKWDNQTIIHVTSLYDCQAKRMFRNHLLSDVLNRNDKIEDGLQVETPTH